MRNKLFIATLASTVATAAIVAPVQIEAAVKDPFKDVSKNSPYYNIIHEMRDLKIISGYENGQFKPNEVITRKHAAALVSRAKDLPVTEKFVKFKDVSEKNAYFNDVKKLQQAGIFEADSKGNFNPNQPITRAEMAKVLAIAFDLKVKEELDFPDVSKSHAANQYVRAIYSNGITTGDNGYFKPDESLTRAHYAVFMHRAMNMKDSPVKPVPKPAVPVTNISLSDLNKQIEKNPLFKGDIKISDLVYKDKEVIRIITEGQKILKDSGLFVYQDSWGGTLYLQEDGYKSTLPMDYMKQITISGNPNGSDSHFLTINFDYSRKSSVDGVVGIMELLYPDLDVEDEIRKKSSEAASAWKKEGHLSNHKREWKGNREVVSYNDWSIYLGVTSFLEFFQITVEMPRE